MIICGGFGDGNEREERRRDAVERKHGDAQGRRLSVAKCVNDGVPQHQALAARNVFVFFAVGLFVLKSLVLGPGRALPLILSFA